MSCWIPALRVSKEGTTSNTQGSWRVVANTYWLSCGLVETRSKKYVTNCQSITRL